MGREKRIEVVIYINHRVMEQNANIEKIREYSTIGRNRKARETRKVCLDDTQYTRDSGVGPKKKQMNAGYSYKYKEDQFYPSLLSLCVDEKKPMP